jgi:organic radical activating enzyme
MLNEKISKLDIHILLRYLSDIKENNDIKSVCFTGGEVFLYYDDLKYLISIIKSYEINSMIITNCSWAKNIDYTLEKLYDLKSTGLSYITISYDEFHSEFINVDCIKNVIKVSKKIGIGVSIQCVIVNNSNNGWWLETIKEELNDIKINFIPCYPVGYAELNIDEKLFIRNYDINGLKCRKGGSYSIMPDGNIWPCCSPYITKTGLLIDNIYNNTNINTTLNKLKNNIILYALRNYGFDFFINIAKNDLNMKLPSKCISSCELCSYLFNIKNIYKFIPYVSTKLSLNSIR